MDTISSNIQHYGRKSRIYEDCHDIRTPSFSTGKSRAKVMKMPSKDLSHGNFTYWMLMAFESVRSRQIGPCSFHTKRLDPGILSRGWTPCSIYMRGLLQGNCDMLWAYSLAGTCPQTEHKRVRDNHNLAQQIPGACHLKPNQFNSRGQVAGTKFCPCEENGT